MTLQMQGAERFQEVPASRLLALAQREAASRERPAAGEAPPGAQTAGTGVIAELEAAADDVGAALGGRGLTLAVKEMLVRDAHEGPFSGAGEIYVVTSLLDGSGAEPQFTTKEFHDIGWGDELPLGGGGLLVGSVRDPGWFIDFHMLVMESDAGTRAAGETLQEVRESSGLDDALKLAGEISRFDPTRITQVTAAVDVFLAALSAALRADGDDHVATVHDFYLKPQGFGVGRHPEQGRAAFGDVELAYEIEVVDLT